MSVIEGATAADTIYAIDRVADDTLIDWFEQHWPDVEVVSEGLEESVVIGRDPTWTVIVDPIDGTRGLMYDKRPAWCLAAAAPHGGSLSDVVAASMTEVPTVKQGEADQLSAIRGGGVVSERMDLRGRARHTLAGTRRRRPTSSTASAGSPSSSCRQARAGRARGGAFRRLGCRHVFDDEYISSGGQLHELHRGPRPFRRRPPTPCGSRRPRLSSLRHLHGACCSRRPEASSPIPGDNALDAPLDTTSPVAWVGYPNEALASRIGPVLTELVDELVER